MVKVTLDELTQKINANTENITRLELLNEEMNHKWEIITEEIAASNERIEKLEAKRQIDLAEIRRIGFETSWLMKKIDAKT